MNGTDSSREKPDIRYIVECAAEKKLWNDENKRVDICLIPVENDEIILRLQSPQDDPEVLEEYPDSVIVWQTIRMDPYDVSRLMDVLQMWMNEEI